MGIDIRLPIGILFFLLGIILTGYGALGDISHYRPPLDVNINLVWGMVLLVFGVLMFLFGRRGMRATSQKDSSPSSHSSGQ
jgi:hypothetical protein